MFEGRGVATFTRVRSGSPSKTMTMNRRNPGIRYDMNTKIQGMGWFHSYLHEPLSLFTSRAVA
jgi:hypothetical protein